MPNDTKQYKRVYKLGEGYAITSEGEPLYSVTFTIHYTPGFEGGNFYMASGDARNGNGTFLHPHQILEPHWRRDLLASGAEWLLPLLERMAQGEDITDVGVLTLYQKVHGKQPAHEEWPLH